MKALLATLSILFALTRSGLADTPVAGSPDLVVHLLDYLAKDYGGAVHDGKVVNQSEYEEQVEFAKIVLENMAQIATLNSNQEYKAEAKTLAETIRAKGPSYKVTDTARHLQQETIRILNLVVEPKDWPSLAHGAQLFQSLCVSCHGATGQGDGPAGTALEPKPANFHDPDLIAASSPYQFYNAVRLGVPGTGMVAYSQLSDRDAWAIAFYLKSLPHKKPEKSPAAADTFNLEQVSTLSDAAMAEKLGGSNAENLTTIAALRTRSAEDNKQDHLAFASSLLDQSLAAASRGDVDQAKNLALRSYLEGIEPIEPKLKANAPELVPQVEKAYGNYRTALSFDSPQEELQDKVRDINTSIAQIRRVFAESQMSPAVAFGASFSILLREGFEAVLIIILLISILRALGHPEAVKWVHIGWFAALVVGVIAWFASGFLVAISGLERELMEGIISLFAVVVLLYVGFWLHRYAAAKQWREFLERKLKGSLSSGRYITLAAISFTAVFREAFEVVLFLRAIWLDLDQTGQNYAGAGVMASFVLLIACSYFVIKESRRLPLGLLFQFCSWTMVMLAIILAGKGAHSLQEAGWLGNTSTSLWPNWDLLGFYATVQTSAVQLAVILVFAVLWYSDRYRANKKTPAAAA